MNRITLERPNATLVGTCTGDGPGVLLLHAGGERRDVWQPIAESLAANGYRCIAYDLRGHGDSDSAGSDELATHVDDVVAMIAAEPDPITLVGASLGGLASVLALADPDVRRRISGMALVDVVPYLDPGRVRGFLNGLRDGYGDRPLVLDTLRRRAELENATTGLAELPTLLVRGELSPVTDHESRRFSAQVPHAVIRTVRGAGHLVARDAPADLAELLLTFLNSPQARRRRMDLLLDAVCIDDIAHPGGKLRNHLDRTAATLESWGAPGWVADAGRVHAAYGTDGFPQAMPGLAPARIVAAAGVETERLVDLYGRCDRTRSYATFRTDSPMIVDRHTGEQFLLTATELRAFVELTAANELDVVAHSQSVAAEHGAELSDLFARLAPLLSPAARDAWSAMSATVSSTAGKSVNVDSDRA
ncbi:alpha/beta fold hydrolase [Antrihabitans cavernicola]|uniref:Alpha/beta hydrolase n=1 Tax=Antrihabitans cavernicola TaxID=2495913 RepID=A0A5A7S415_9NOCA|nr:alpha/beta fold hydrolase [Spelaeibacter cavernicola]KAA0016773.1 alpha/beta hydrolase [Spelaeibacter cavernicola]